MALFYALNNLNTEIHMMHFDIHVNKKCRPKAEGINCWLLRLGIYYSLPGNNIYLSLCGQRFYALSFGNAKLLGA